MASLKDIARVANGVSLVAKEAINRSRTDSIIKAALLSAADAAGITKGKLRPFEPQTPTTDDTVNHGTSIIYFTDESPHDIDADANVPLPAPSTSTSSDLDPLISSDQAPPTAAPSTSNGTLIPPNQRKPRERRVPTTPFSRALG